MSGTPGIRRRTILRGAAAAAALPAIGSSGAHAADVVKIGLPVAVTGPIGGIGEQMKRACEFWAKQVNAKGGLLGKKIELIAEDTGGNPASAVRKV